MNDALSDAGDDTPRHVVVYWRPGCFFCYRLFRALERAGIVAQGRNIWEDDEARRFVQEHNGGAETVPTVAFGELVVTNPRPAELTSLVSLSAPELVGEPQP